MYKTSAEASVAAAAITREEGLRRRRTGRWVEQLRPPIALRTDLSRIRAELWEIPVFSPADGALILHMIS